MARAAWTYEVAPAGAPSADSGRQGGPVDRPTYALAFAALVAVPVFLGLAAGVAAYRVWRSPYERT